MNDTEMLEWVAGHLEKFVLGFNIAHMEYLDNEGNPHNICFESEEINPSDVTMLKGCITMAAKEMMNKHEECH